MANAFVSLALPVGNGAGAATELLEMGAERTVVVALSNTATTGFQCAINIEASEDNTTWGPVCTFTSPGFQNVRVASRYMRARVSGFLTYGNGAPTCSVGADDSNTTVVTLNVPAGNGTGTASDTSSMGVNKSVVVSTSAVWQGVINIEGCAVPGPSAGVDNFVTLCSIDNSDRENIEGAFRFMRVRVSGYVQGTATVTIGGSMAEGEGTLNALDTKIAFGSTTTINVYIGLGGDDTNDGLSTTTPLSTVEAAYRKFPLWAFQGATVVLNFSSAGGFGSAATVPPPAIDFGALTYVVRTLWLGSLDATKNTYRYEGPDMVRVYPAGGAAPALDATPAVRVNNAGGASATGGRTRLDFTTANPGWTVNQFRGRFLRITRAGVKVIYELPIGNNTANTITVDVADLVGVVQNTDMIEVCVPGATFAGDSAAGNANNIAIRGASAIVTSPVEHFAIKKMAFNPPASSFGTIRAHNVSGLSFDRCSFTSGLLVYGCHNFNMTNCLGYWNGTGGGGFVFLTGSSGSFFTAPFDTVAPINTTVGLAVVLTETAGDGAFGVDASQIDTSRTIAAWNCGGSGISVRKSGYLKLASFGTGCFLGSGNPTVGITVGQNSTCLVQGAAERCEITGTGGALRLKAVPTTIAYGTGAGQFQEAAGYNGNFTTKNAGTAAAPVGDASRISTAAD